MTLGFLNHFLAMLDRLGRNKILFLVFSLFVISTCAKKKPIFHTEIICPSGKVILMRYVTEQEMSVAIQRAVFEKRLFGTNENYTVARFPGNRSVKIEKIAPEEIERCQLRQILPDKKSINDARYYMVN